VPRYVQGGGRHDQPNHYGALYVSRVAMSAVAELIQSFRGRLMTDADLRSAGGAQFALASIDDRRLTQLIDLDDPAALVVRGLRPSTIATQDRPVTRAIALALFSEGAVGFGWWSTLEASWPNVTLFAERAAEQLDLATEPEPLTVTHPVFRSAAEAVGVRF
jgi:hypothetical protein